MGRRFNTLFPLNKKILYETLQEAYLEAIFYPGRFASSAISRTLELYGVSEVEEGQLPTLTTIKVEAEVSILPSYTLQRCM